MTSRPDHGFDGGAILMYHRIAPDGDPFHLCVPPARFEADMRWIRSHCHPIPLRAFAEARRAGCLPDRAVAVTLDDGYTDNASEASPVLARLSVPATFFVTTADLDEPGEYWWDTVTRWMLDEPVLPDALNLPAVGPELSRVSTADRVAGLRQIADGLRPLGVVRRQAALGELEACIRPTTPPRVRPMTASQIKNLAGRPGHDVGAHTTHHVMLPVQPVDVQAKEMAECRQALERLLGSRVDSIAYPFGAATAGTVDVAQSVGFDVGVGVAPGPGLAGPLLLPRIDVAALSVPLAEHLGRLFEGQRRGQ